MQSNRQRLDQTQNLSILVDEIAFFWSYISAKIKVDETTKNDILSIV